MSVKIAHIGKLSLGMLLAITLSGCVVAIGDKTERQSDSNWRKTQEFNAQHIRELQVGSRIDDVRAKLGTPDFNELFQKDGEQIQVLFYRTQHVSSDSRTTKDECTPLIFKDNKLVGWGDKAYQYL